MALVERKYEISLDDVRIGQPLEIDYKNTSSSGPSRILVVGQTTDKLHAIKLIKGVDIGSLNVFLRDAVGHRQWYNSNSILDGRIVEKYIKTSRYVETGPKGPYRTYTKNLIRRQSLLMLGQSVNWVNTRKLKIGQSVLYGMAHGSYVYVNNRDLNQLAMEIVSRGYKTYFEGPGEHEDPTQYLLDYLIGPGKYKSNSWDIDLGSEEYVLSLFGGGGSTLFSGVLEVMKERKIFFGQTLVTLLSKTSGRGLTGSYWGSHEISENNIKKIVSSLRESDVNIGVLNMIINNEDELKRHLVPFVDAVQKYAFAEDWRLSRKAQSSAEEDYHGEEVPSFEIEELQKSANRKRDKHLLFLMRNNPGVYFAGEGHIRLVQELL